MNRISMNYMSLDQLILMHIYGKEGKPTTIEELKEEITLPRTTIVDHLKLLEKDMFVKIEKEGREAKYYPVPEVAEKLYSALSELSAAYVYTLDHIRTEELKEIKEVKKKIKT